MKPAINNILILALVLNGALTAWCGGLANEAVSSQGVVPHDHSTHSHSHGAHGHPPAPTQDNDSKQDDTCCSSFVLNAGPAIANRGISIVPPHAFALLKVHEIFHTGELSISDRYKSNVPTGPPKREGLSYYLLYQHLLI